MKTNEMEQGWAFAARLAGAEHSATVGRTYVNEVAKAIEEMEEAINNHPYRGQDVAHFKGYVAEEWHAGTFNINATAAQSADRATVLHSNASGSVDIQLDSGASYSAKVYADGAKSAVAQAAVSPYTGEAAYKDQFRLVPSDQLVDATNEAHRQALRNAEIRPNVSEAYSETERMLVDTVSNDEGISSTAKNRSDFEDMARSVKESEFRAEDAGVTVDTAITNEYMLQQALKAGYSAAAITVAIQLAPDIYKSIDYLIKTGRIDIQSVKKMGINAVSAGAEGFLRGSVACYVQIMCVKGALGEAFKAADPTMVGAIVSIAMGTVKNSILVAAGKMTPKQMGAAFVDSVVVTSGYLLGTKIGGMIGQALGFEAPIVGYLLGSIVGCSLAAVYNIGKKKLISFCVDTGFTCFGLVEQDYTLPDEVLSDMGIEKIRIARTPVKRNAVAKATVSHAGSRTKYETIDIHMLRRGVIGVNKIGYFL